LIPDIKKITSIVLDTIVMEPEPHNYSVAGTEAMRLWLLNLKFNIPHAGKVGLKI
jgi:hypothetical protein